MEGAYISALGYGRPSNGLAVFDTVPRERWATLMHIVDRVNLEAGASVLHLGAEGVRKRWRMRQEHRSTCYTTAWADIHTIQV